MIESLDTLSTYTLYILLEIIFRVIGQLYNVLGKFLLFISKVQLNILSAYTGAYFVAPPEDD